MSNVFDGSGYIRDDDPILLGTLKRARDFLEKSDPANTPYTKPYKGKSSPSERYAGLSPRTPDNFAAHIAKFRTYYGVASGLGVDGYPSYNAIYNTPDIYCYFHLIKFGITNAYANPSTGTLTLDCRRDSSTHAGLPLYSNTDTHGMGNTSFKYTDTVPRKFDLSGFDTSVASEWGNYLNLADNGGTQFYLKVIDAQSVEVYTDSGHTTPVNIGPSGLNWSAYTSGGFAVISNGQTSSFQMIYMDFIDRSNSTYTAYDKDYYTGYGNSVNNDFGANIVGARTSYFVNVGLSTSTFTSNVPTDYLSTPDFQTDSQYNPSITLICSGDGLPYTGSGDNGCITGATFNMELGGLMFQGGTSTQPYAIGAECLVLPAPYDSDASAGYDFSVSNITQASPAVVTFTNSIYDQTAVGSEDAVKVFNDVEGMTEINGQLLYLKQTSHNTAEIYTDANLTVPLDSTAYTAYTSGGNLQDYDNNVFIQSTVFGGDYTGRTLGSDYENFAPMPLSTTNSGSADQIWPRTVSPAKMDIQLIQPTRKTYGQDLTRYTNSTGAYGYRLTLTYNNISKDAWREFDGFIKGMRGASAPFHFYYFNNTDGGGYRVFDSSQDTVDTWEAASPVLAKDIAVGDTAIWLTGFSADGSAPGTNTRIVSRTNDVFFSAHTYRNSYTANNVGFASGEFQTNEFGEAIIRFTHPIKNAISTLDNSVIPTRGFTYLQCMLADDEVEYDFHPIGDFVSFKVDLDVV